MKRTKKQLKALRLRNLAKARKELKRLRKRGKKTKSKTKGSGKEKFKVCFCASSINWILRNLKKSSKKRFRKMIGR